MSETVFSAAMPSLVHPLDDAPEQKLYRPDLGRMRMTTSVRCALYLLQAYLAAMILLVGWRAFTML
jgi:hypothetical protein